ncbi:GGDEF domain-containing protein [Marinitoga sp. 1135]|nr:GGDEF domain-containing protein [Marinitoga sp. 1135]
MFIEKFPNFKKFMPIFQVLTYFKDNKNEMDFSYLEEIENTLYEIGFRGIIYNNEAYSVIYVADITRDIILYNKKYLEVAEKLRRETLSLFSPQSFDSMKLYNKIFETLREEGIIDSLVIATLKDNKIYIDFGYIENIEYSNKIFPRDNKSLTNFVIDKAQKIYIPNSVKFKLPEGYEIYHVTDPKVYSVYGVPLKKENKVFGAILYEKVGEDSFTKNEIRLMDEITNIIDAIIIFKDLYNQLNEERKKYYEASIRDYLTGAYNRAFFEGYFKKLCEKSKRYNEIFSIAFIDINDFKLINDRYGHNVGDLILKEFARIVHETIRGSDIFARYGGDEFVIIFPNTNKKDATLIMKRIEMKTLKIKENISFSYGIIEVSHELSPEENLKLVDDLMYKMKRNKKSCD